MIIVIIIIINTPKFLSKEVEGGACPTIGTQIRENIWTVQCDHLEKQDGITSAFEKTIAYLICLYPNKLSQERIYKCNT